MSIKEKEMIIKQELELENGEPVRLNTENIHPVFASIFEHHINHSPILN